MAQVRVIEIYNSHELHKVNVINSISRRVEKASLSVCKIPGKSSAQKGRGATENETGVVGGCSGRQEGGTSTERERERGGRLKMLSRLNASVERERSKE